MESLILNKFHLTVACIALVLVYILFYINTSYKLDTYEPKDIHFIPKFKKHGIPHFYAYDKSMKRSVEPIKEQLFEHPNRLLFASVEVDKMKDLLNGFFKTSQSIKLDNGRGSGIVICGYDSIMSLYQD